MPVTISANVIGNYQNRVPPFTSRRGNYGSLGRQLRGARIVSLRAAIASDTSIAGENDARWRGARQFRHLFPECNQSRREHCNIHYQGEHKAAFLLLLQRSMEESRSHIFQVNNECFTTPKNIEVPALRSASFDVTYEPCDVENVSATMTATSEIAGEFVYDNSQLKLILCDLMSN